MSRLRVIPVLLSENSRLVKGVKFKRHKYIGDTLNAIKIFNEKEVDELMLLDITATKQEREPDYNFLHEIASEAFFPMGYGGGITSVKQIEKILRLGIEKVVLGTAAFTNPQFVYDAVAAVGSQSIVVSVDYRKALMSGLRVYVKNGKLNTKYSPQEYAKKMEDLGAGELIVTSIEREGTGAGYDLDILKVLSEFLSIPIVASGGAGKISDFINARDICNVQAVSAGSMFVYYGPHKAVLINYPPYETMSSVFNRSS